MKAIGLYKYLPIENEQSLIDVEVAKPSPIDRDILVSVHAISVNPVDTKVRAPKDQVEESARILGWDAAGEVVAIGDQVEHYQVGDRVYYAGDVTRPGSYSEYQLVDERIVGHMPKHSNFADAAALPLTSITAWEGLFERLKISKKGQDAGKTILIIGGAGGVGSIAIQLASKIANLKVIATASRKQTQDWCSKLGANYVINHHNSLVEELAALNIKSVDYIFCLNNTDQHWSAIAEIIAPQGSVSSIVETKELVDLNLLKSKSVSFTWEFMFTRSMYKTQDLIEQQNILNAIANLIDDESLVTTLSKEIKPINAENMRKAHTIIEQGSAIGKIVLTDWT